MSQVRVLLDRKNCNVFYFLSRAKNDLYYGKTIKQIKRRSTNNDHRIASGIRLYLAFLYRRICYRYRIQYHQMDFQNPNRTDQMAWLRLKKDFSSLTKKRCRTHYTQCGLAFILRVGYRVYNGRNTKNERRTIMVTKRFKLFGVTYVYARVYPVYEGNPNDVCDIINVHFTKKEATDEIKTLKEKNPGKNYWTKKRLTPYSTIKEAK